MAHVSPQGTIYGAVGGAEVIARIVEAHHRRCLADEVLNHPFSHPGKPDHLERLACYWGEVLGGPPGYTNRFGMGSDVLAMHAATGAQSDMGDRFLACFIGALDDAGVAATGPVREALIAYMTWATGAFMAVAPAGSTVAPALPVPRFGWDGPEG